MYTQVVVGGATREGLSASDKDTSLRESGVPSEEVLSQSVKEIVLSKEPTPQPPKVIDTPDPEPESKERGTPDEALPHPPLETSSSTVMEFDFVQRPPEDYFCPVTFELLLTPHLTACCGNYLSERAVKRLKQEGKPCPLCKEPELATMLDKRHVRRIREVRVRCPHTARGCEWVGEVGQLNSHTDSCLMRHMEIAPTSPVSLTV